MPSHVLVTYIPPPFFGPDCRVRMAGRTLGRPQDESGRRDWTNNRGETTERARFAYAIRNPPGTRFLHQCTRLTNRCIATNVTGCHRGRPCGWCTVYNIIQHIQHNTWRRSNPANPPPRSRGKHHIRGMAAMLSIGRHMHALQRTIREDTSAPWRYSTIPGGGGVPRSSRCRTRACSPSNVPNHHCSTPLTHRCVCSCGLAWLACMDGGRRGQIPGSRHS